MKYLQCSVVAIGLLLGSCSSTSAQDPSRLRNGDIIFQTSQGELGEAIQIATGSKYSHVGIIYFDEGQAMVFEAVQPVRSIPLVDWVNNGRKGHFVIKRIKQGIVRLSPAIEQRMLALGRQFDGLDYDIYFNWSDERMYCSELVWKLYHRVLGLRIGEPAALKTFALNDPIVQARLRLHYGDDIPWEEQIISPQAMFDSELLMTVMTDKQERSKKKVPPMAGL